MSAAKDRELTGPIPIEWEEAGIGRLLGAPETLTSVCDRAFDAPSASFDAAFSGGG